MSAKIKEFDKWIKKIRKDREDLQSDGKIEEEFKEKYIEFLNDLEFDLLNEYDKIVKFQNSMEVNYSKTALMFGEESKKLKMETLFKTLDTFISKFKAICM